MSTAKLWKSSLLSPNADRS